MCKGQIYFLQARPITSHFAQATVFDGSNIQESYPGSTSLLTYSFARRAYCGVYKSFMRFMGVSEAVVKDKTEVFENLLAYKNSHIYYNLNNWYSLIALLPNYRQTRQFMEKMMGLESPCELDLDSFAHSDISRFGLLKSGIALTINYLNMEKHSKKFFKQAAQLQARARHLEQLSYGELVKFYLELERELLDQWQAPIANDFFAMIFYGLLARQYEKQAPEANSHYLFNLLLAGHGGISSAEPPKLLKEIAQNLQDASLAEKFVSAVKENSLAEALALVRSNQLGHDNWSILLERFGDRSIGELKLETKTYRQDPGLLLKILAGLVESSGDFPSGRAASLAVVASADSELQYALNHSFKNPLLAWLGAQARVFLARRENMRLVRSQVFGIVRAIVCEFGRHLERHGIIDNADDVFYLEISELLCLPSYDSLGYWNQVVALRKSRAQEMTDEAPRRLVQYGLRPALAVLEEEVQSSDATRLMGLGASVGKVRGVARVIAEPEEETMAGYDILVAKRTDPGWIVHFAMCKGIVTTHGSLLSHTAIVAREMQIPAVVSVPGATALIATGDLIEIDGSSGAVTILAGAKVSPLKITA
jgi:pyruvate,water dikinase